MGGPPPRALLVQGVYLPDDARTRRILTQGAFLRARPPAERLVYITVDNYLVAKQAGAWPDLPLQVANAFWGTFTVDQYRGLVRSLRGDDVRQIYFDSTLGLSAEEAKSLPEVLLFYRKLRERLSPVFAPGRTVAGWEEVVRR